MKKTSIALWTFVLLFSLGLIVVLLLNRQERAVPLPTVTVVLPTETPRSLAAAPTRFQATVALLPTATPLIFAAAPTSTPVAVTLSPPETQALPPALPDSYRIVIPQAAAPGSMLINYCPAFGTPLSLRIYDWSSGTTTSLSDAEIAQIPLGWDASANLWQGYQSAHPFNQPDDARQRWNIDLYLPDGTDRWIIIYESPATPGRYYTYVFENTVAYADKNGNHFGNHPCRAFAAPASQVGSFLDAIRQYQQVIQYPPFISGNDPRWKRGVAKPNAAYADLRSIPSNEHNNPIGGIDTSVPLWFALDPAWDGWAQVRIGSVQGWVNTQTVNLTPDG